eukprot:TRINITY_DN79806_c0_g1_i1.p1 TRINITY_DN79806_c0_g1~~TRINITY_DN79806_c0_g1_i1.p1  ORF type:complete len:263 (+),score=35.46 TRINITY_DN79806_c0_g1_i1:115-789(+)
MAAVGSFFYNHAANHGHSNSGTMYSSKSDDDGYRSRHDWSRSFSAGDIVGMRRTPQRRPLDAAQPHQDLLSPSSTMEVMTPKRNSAVVADPLGRQNKLQYSSRIEGVFSPSNSATRQDRALDCWPLGEGLRIMHHIQPKKYRAISLYGEVYQGHWATDWKDVSHVKQLRSKTPVGRASLQPAAGPVPQGMTDKELQRNRAFGESHGSTKLSQSIIRVGNVCLVP